MHLFLALDNKMPLTVTYFRGNGMKIEPETEISTFWRIHLSITGLQMKCTINLRNHVNRGHAYAM